MGILSFLFRRRKVEIQPPQRPQITPEQVEACIDRAGRAKVFARAQELGWNPSNPPPLWVWRLIATEIECERPPTTIDGAFLLN